MLVRKAYAKLNLTLEVLGPRPDGYHDIASVMQTIDLADALSFEPCDRLGLHYHSPSPPTGEGQDEGVGTQLPPPTENLVYKAASLLKQTFGVSKGATINLQKHIPVAAGLGGGSSDAAATLLALNELWDLKLGLAELFGLAAQVGSDVPYFLHGGTVLVEGRGERLTPLPACPRFWAVVLVPPVSLPQKTARMYSLLRPEHFTSGERSARLAEVLRTTGAVRKSPLGNLIGGNAFEPVADAAFPGLQQYRSAFLNAGVGQVHLAGSGPTLFTIAPNRNKANAIYQVLRAQEFAVYLSQSVFPQVFFG